MEYQQNNNTSASDKDLIMLVDFCKKTIATVGGDGHSEIVLYFNDKTGEYTVHTYEMYQPSTTETHKAYKSDREYAEKVFDIIKKEKLAEAEGIKDIGMCGGEIVCKFNRDGLDGATKESTMIRITSTMGNVHPVGSFMYTATTAENEIK